MLSINMEEVFKPIDGLNGIYECSNFGRIRRKNKDKRCDEYKYLKLQLTKDGYLSVNPTTAYRKRVHRIVAELFIPNVDNKPIVNHKDCNKLNNHVDNLEWVTHKENSVHANENGRMGNSKYLILDTSTGIFYESAKDLALVLGRTKQDVSKLMLKGKIDTRFEVLQKQYEANNENAR